MNMEDHSRSQEEPRLNALDNNRNMFDGRHSIFLTKNQSG